MPLRLTARRHLAMLFVSTLQRALQVYTSLDEGLTGQAQNEIRSGIRAGEGTEQPEACRSSRLKDARTCNPYDLPFGQVPDSPSSAHQPWCPLQTRSGSARTAFPSFLPASSGHSCAPWKLQSACDLNPTPLNEGKILVSRFHADSWRRFARLMTEGFRCLEDGEWP